ncbi:unnamed protein product [Strongylus vulgaris]|uniref:Uncharacterized protein n=1 Tax=Strongylus vulgaris TaxID=40348 RepID=A0A3P7J8I5_STRVU|nr:unnamed protein product [Strongylus vulgaris]
MTANEFVLPTKNGLTNDSRVSAEDQQLVALVVERVSFCVPNVRNRKVIVVWRVVVVQFPTTGQLFPYCTVSEGRDLVC